MIDLLKSISPLFKKYKIESILIIMSLLIAIASLFLFIETGQEEPSDQILFQEKNSSNGSYSTGGKIFVDISGAVNKPGVYELKRGSRLKDALTLAKGITDEASKDFFTRNYNLAKILSDQEKIYIPFTWEFEQGIFTENSRTLNYTQPRTEIAATSAEDSLININTASFQELDTLSGIGKVTAEKIIQNRPYQSVEELLNKKIVKKNVYDNIKDLITTQ